MLKDIVDALKAGGVEVEQVARGADHGLWGKFSSHISPYYELTRQYL